MASGFHFLLLLCVTSGLLAAASCCEEKEKHTSCTVPCCPSGWTQFGSRCFIFYYSGKSWIDAERFCTSIGGNLASIHKADEHLFVRSLIHRSSGSYKRTWIGGFDSVKEGVWLWTDGSKFDYRHWAANEPNNIGQEHCIEMNWQGNFWNDLACSHSFPFVCSKDM